MAVSLPVLRALLDHALSRTASPRGNVQLIDWRTRRLSIVLQRGFTEEALAPFAHLPFKPGHSTACMRAVRLRCTIMIEDTDSDAEFAPYRKLAQDAGFRSVASVPIISGGGALLGVVSVHNPTPHLFPKATLDEISAAASVAAQQLLQLRARRR